MLNKEFENTPEIRAKVKGQKSKVKVKTIAVNTIQKCKN